jgi:hypothetical protein
MGLKEVLEKMKLVEVEESEAAEAEVPPPPAVRPSVPPPPRSAASPPARRLSMDEVLKPVGGRPKIDESALSAAAAGDDVPDFAAIYKAAGVKEPSHGYSAPKVLEILSSSELAPLPAAAKAAALSGFLKMNPTGPVPIADVIKDAVARDQALDGFEDFLKKKLEARRAELDKENVRLQAEIDEVSRRNKEKMDANRHALDGEKERLAAWQTRKRIEERKLFDAVSPFVEENPVSIAGQNPSTTPRPSKPGGS